MKIPLLATVAELKYRLSMPRGELDILRLINMAPPQNWEISVTVLEGQKVFLKATGSNIDDYSILVNGIVASVFECEALEVVKEGRRWRSTTPLEAAAHDSNELHFDDAGPVKTGIADLTLCGFAGNRIPASFSDADKIRDHLFRNTWLGSGGIKKGHYSLRFKVLGKMHVIENASVTDEALSHQEKDGVPVLRLETQLGTPPLGRIFLKTHFGMKYQIFRWTYGLITSTEKLDWLLAHEALSLPAEIEFTLPKTEFAPDGTFGLDGEIKRLPAAMKEFFEFVLSSPKTAAYLKACADYEKKQSAKLIDRRKKDLLTTDFVFYAGDLVYKAPTSENELVSLHQKLEGMGALPLAFFVSLEYTPKLGIDAIVHFKIRPTEALTKFATVEFEFHYENFFAHGHPIEQTDLIICWGRRFNSNSPMPTSDPDLPWLSQLVVQGRVIRVVEVSKYPKLTLKKLSEANL